MKVTSEITKLENSTVKLTVTVEKKDVAKSYDEILAKYAKTIQIPGFRKGKAPTSVLEKKFGESLKSEACAELIDKALEKVFAQMDKEQSENRPLPYAQPELDGGMPILDTSKDLTFAIQYDVLPKVTITDLNNIAIKEPQVKIGDEELNQELQAIRERNAMVMDKKDDEKAEKNDIVTITYSELDDENNIIPDTTREGFVFTIGSGENIYKIDDEIIGMKKDESKNITKKYDKDFNDKDLAGTTKKIRVTVTSLKVRNLPELDDELAQDVNNKYKTLEDMKKDISKNLQLALENRLKEIKSNDLVEQLIEKFPMELPQSMVKMELESRWRMMAQRFQTSVEQLDKMIAASGQKKEDMLAEWTGDAKKMLKGRIIIETLLKDRNIEVSDEEVEAEYAKISEGAGMSVEEVKKHYSDANRKEYLIDDIKEQKLYDQLFAEIKISKGEKKTFAELFTK
ncbi:MAG: trigger factor [Treponema sp.]|nr:trigger factor [Treponema sp.]